MGTVRRMCRVPKGCRRWTSTRSWTWTKVRWRPPRTRRLRMSECVDVFLNANREFCSRTWLNARQESRHSLRLSATTLAHARWVTSGSSRRRSTAPSRRSTRAWTCTTASTRRWSTPRARVTRRSMRCARCPARVMPQPMSRRLV